MDSKYESVGKSKNYTNSFIPSAKRLKLSCENNGNNVCKVLEKGFNNDTKLSAYKTDNNTLKEKSEDVTEIRKSLPVYKVRAR